MTAAAAVLAPAALPPVLADAAAAAVLALAAAAALLALAAPPPVLADAAAAALGDFGRGTRLGFGSRKIILGFRSGVLPSSGSLVGREDGSFGQSTSIEFWLSLLRAGKTRERPRRHRRRRGDQKDTVKKGPIRRTQ